MPDATASSRATRFVRAEPEDVYAAFVDPDAIVDWLPPGDMTGAMHAFDGRVGGGYLMSLFYTPEPTPRGKTTTFEDRVAVKFVELAPPRKIVEAIRFASDDPAQAGEMTLTATFEEVPGGTQVALLFENLPPGVNPDDNDTGAQQSLDQLARRLER